MLKISRSLLEQIRRQVAAGYPDEVCGVLLGTDGTIAEVVPAANTERASARNRYQIHPLAHRDLELDAARRGMRVLGVYHSHPDDAARPSPFDRDNAWPNLSYLIVSVERGQPRAATSWRLRADGSQFDPETVEISEPTAY